MKPLLCLLLLLFGWTGCQRELVSPEDDIDGRVFFQNIEEAGGFVLTSPGTQVFREDPFGRTLWGSTWSLVDEQGLKTPPPAIGFDKKMVIAVFWGKGFTGCGNGIRAITEVTRRDGDLVVEIGTFTLGPCDEAIFPIQMIQIDQSDLPVVFEGNVPR